jgi:hypothetical protein
MRIKLLKYIEDGIKVPIIVELSQDGYKGHYDLKTKKLTAVPQSRIGRIQRIPYLPPAVFKAMLFTITANKWVFAARYVALKKLEKEKKQGKLNL